MKISILLRAEEPDESNIEVSTTLELDVDDPHWQAWLVDAVAGQAKAAARRLRDELIAQEGLPVKEFVPLAALLPATGTGR